MFSQARKTALVGLEFDSSGIRGIRLTPQSSGSPVLASAHEMRGNFNSPAELSAGLASVRSEIGIQPEDSITACFSGRQVYVAQMAFRDLPEAEVGPALRLEVRKSLPFEAAKAEIEFQIIGPSSPGQVELIVAAAAQSLIAQNMVAMDRAGIRPWVIDLLPLAAANAFHAIQGEDGDGEMAHVVLHMGPEICTFVAEGRGRPFFHRNIHAPLAEMLGGKAGDMERQRRMEALVEEIARSLAFYEKTYSGVSIGRIWLAGSWLENGQFASMVTQRTRLPAEPLGNGAAGLHASPGLFSLAYALALRGAETN